MNPHIDHIPIPAWVCSNSNKILAANQPATDFYGYSPAAFRKMYLHQLCTARYAILVRKVKLKNEETCTLQLEQKNSTGKSIWVQLSLRQHTLRKKKVRIITATDISDLINHSAKPARTSSDGKRQTQDNTPQPWQLSLIASHTSNAVFFTDLESRITWANKGFERISGYTLQEVIGKRPGSFSQGPETDKETLAHMRELIATKRSARVELLNYAKNGSTYWSDVEVMPLHEDGVHTGFMVIETDITSLKNAAQEIAKGSQQLGLMINNLPATCAIFQRTLDGDGHVKNFYISPGIETMTGLPMEKIKDLSSLKSLIHASDKEVYQLILNPPEGSPNTSEREIQLFRKKETRWLHIRYRFARADNGERQMNGLLTDITERKTLQDAIKNHQANLNAILQNSDNAYVLYNRQLEIVSFNSLANEYATLYLNKELKAGAAGLGYYAPSRRPVVEKLMQRALAGETVSYTVNYPKPDHSVTHFSGRFFPVNEVARSGIMLALTDVTKQKHIEDELKRERNLFASGPVIVITWSPDAGFPVTYVSENVQTILGYSQQEMYDPGFHYADYIHPDDRQRIESEVAEAFANRTRSFEQSYRLKTKRGEYLWVYDVTLFDRNKAGEVTTIRGYLFDQTKLKEVEQELFLSKSYFESLVKSQTSYLIRTDMEGRYVFVNNQFYKKFSHEQGSLLGTPSLDTVMPVDHELTRQTVIKCFEQPGKVFPVTLRKPKRGGGYYWTEWEFVALQDEHGALQGIQGVGLDSTERVVASYELKKMTDRLLLAKEAAQMGVWEWDIASGEVHWDDQQYSLCGVPKGQPITTEFFGQLIAPDDRDRYSALPQKAIDEGGVDTYFHVVRFDTGKEIYLKTYGKLERDDSGSPLRMVGVNYDITEQVLAAKKIEESEARYRSIVEDQPDMIIRYRPDITISFVNSAFLRFFNAQADQVIGKPLMDFIPPENQAEALVRITEALKGNSTEENIQPATDFSGKKYWFAWSSRPLFDRDGIVKEVQAIGRNVTTRLELEKSAVELNEKLRGLLGEKDMLIREIHHRVKNNLQVMSSVLFLKSQSLRDPAMRQLLTESRHRLRSMSLIHERLMQSGGEITNVEMKGYLTSLLDELRASHSISSEYIEIAYDLDEVNLSLDQATNCGFIVNETITNAIKHAFTDNRKGRAFVSFKKMESGFRLTIADNGVGLPPHVTLTNTNLFGIQLVKVFVSHLRGSVTLDGNDGTTWQIHF